MKSKEKKPAAGAISVTSIRLKNSVGPEASGTEPPSSDNVPGVTVRPAPEPGTDEEMLQVPADCVSVGPVRFRKKTPGEFGKSSGKE